MRRSRRRPRRASTSSNPRRSWAGDPPDPVAEPVADGEVIDRGVIGLLGLLELAGESALFGDAIPPTSTGGAPTSTSPGSRRRSGVRPGRLPRRDAPGHRPVRGAAGRHRRRSAGRHAGLDDPGRGRARPRDLHQLRLRRGATNGTPPTRRARSPWSPGRPGARGAASPSSSARPARPSTSPAARPARSDRRWTGRRRSRRPPSSSTRPAGAGIAVAGRPPRARRGARRWSPASTTSRARLHVLVNDIFGADEDGVGQDGLGVRSSTSGCALLRLAIDTHAITSHFALPLLIKTPGGLVVEVTDGTDEYNADQLPGLVLLRPRARRR